MAKSGRDIDLIRREIQDLKLSIQREPPPANTVEQVVKTKRRPAERTIKYPGTQSTVSRSGVDTDTTEVRPNHDLAEVLRLQDIEPYFAVSVDRHVELIMKRGFAFKGRNPETVAYVRRRIREIGLISDQPFTDLIREVTRNVVSVSNAYIVFYRDSSRSTGVRTRMWGRERDPIAGVSSADPSTVTVRQTRSGRASQFVQKVPGYRERSWAHHDVVHIAWRRKSGNLFGVPFVIPALEDIRALRKLEMVAEHVSHKYAFPLMHWKVGTEKIPAGKITDHSTGRQVAEVAVASEYAEQLAQEGFVVTSERHEVKIIGADGEALDLQPFIEHYEKRVIAGLRLSMMDLGRGDTANRGTSTTLSQILVDSCTEIQSIIAEFITERLVDHLVMEGGYNLTDENRVYFLFPAINTEEERAAQNHGLQLYVQGGITRAEFRRDYLAMDDLTPEEEANLYLNEHLIPLAKATAAIKAAAAKKPGGSSSSAVGNRAQPTNQHGKLPTAPRLPANDAIDTAWSHCASAVVQYVDQKVPRDCRPAFTQAFRDMANVIEDELYDLWKRGIEAGYTAAGVKPPELLTEKLSANELHQVQKLLATFRTRDLQQIQASCMVNADIEQRTGLPKSSSVLGLVMASFQSSKVLLDAKVERVRRAAAVIGYIHGHRAAGKTEVNFGNTEILKIDALESAPDAIRSIALTSRLQAFPIFTEQNS